LRNFKFLLTSGLFAGMIEIATTNATCRFGAKTGSRRLAQAAGIDDGIESVSASSAQPQLDRLRVGDNDARQHSAGYPLD
jgi:hypothetical protein